MENIHQSSARLIADAYEHYRPQVLRYACSRIGNTADAEDLTQDVFLRLMDYQQLICPATVRSFIFTITRNVVFDYLRCTYRQQELSSYMYDTQPALSDDIESRLIVRDLRQHELNRVSQLPPQRQKVYMLTRYAEKPVPEIAQMMHLSVRTVENHLHIGRKEVRAYMQRLIG